MMFPFAILLVLTVASQVKSQCGPGQQSVELSIYKKKEIHIVSTGGFQSNMTCSWKVSSPHPSAHILVQLKGVWLGNDDYISIYDGHNENTTALVSNFTGQSASTDLKDASSGKALVVFTSGHKQKKGERGFTVILLAITTPKSTMDCKNETLIATKTDKYLTSPGFPDEYPTNTICYWTIQVLSKKHSLHLEFLFIDIEEGNKDCSYDYVEAYKKDKDGTKTTLFTICKRNQWDKISFNVSEKEVFLKFLSDGTDSRTGFLLRYSSAVVPGFKTAKGKGAGPRSQVVTEKPSAVSHTTLASEITPVVPKLPEADMISLALPPCGMCCTYSGVDCFQDCTLCHRPPWDIFTNPDVMNFNFNAW